MNKISLTLLGLVLLIGAGCANVKLISSENNKYKYCTNPGNQVAKASDFDEAADKQCGGNGKYRKVSNGLEFFTDPSTKKIGGVLEVQTQRRMCYVYECGK